MGKITLWATLLLATVIYTKAQNKIVCYYDSHAHYREGQGKFENSFLDPALQHCTHLMYGYAGIDEETYKLVPLDERYDVTSDNYRSITDLRRKYPNLKVLLSVGGNADLTGSSDDKNYERNVKYRTLIETSERRMAFVNSAITLINHFGFDGLDLAWEFPETKPKKIRSTVGSWWHKVKKTVAGDKIYDELASDHREQFVALVREVKNAFRGDNLLVTLTVLPNVNSTVYYDPRVLTPYLDFVNLFAFDYYSPTRNPKEADYPAPLYPVVDRRPDENGDAEVRYWLDNGGSNKKIVFGIPTYGRAWKLDEDSTTDGIPPFEVDGAADPGPYTKVPGLLSYPEICNLIDKSNNQLRKVTDPAKRYGTYAYRLPDGDGNGGIWIGFDDPDTAANKASFVRAKGLGGIAIIDLTLDDFRGLCSGTKYPILVAAKYRL